jgi:hypothetical protein
MKYQNDALQAAKILYSEDWNHCRLLYEANSGGQAERRCLIRAGFAFIEAWIYSCRYQSVRGDTDLIPKKVTAKQNVHESLSDLSEVLKSSHVIDKTKDPGWCAMTQAYKIRDRITHPKSPKDLNITDGDMKVFFRATIWLNETAGNIEAKRLES